MILALVFPLLIHAQTTVVLQPGPLEGNDSKIYSLGLDSNYGNRHSLNAYTWTNRGRLVLKRIFLSFDLDTIPDNAMITEARLSLYYNPLDSFESFSVHSGDNELYVQRVTEDWAESQITWRNQPATTTDGRLTIPQSSSPTQDYEDIDVTELVQAMADTANGNYGFMIRLVDEVNYYKGLLFASSEHRTPSLRPKLEITYRRGRETCRQLKPGPFDGKDSKIHDLRPDSNFGSRSSLNAYTWTSSGRLTVKRFFMEFDLSEVPTNADITSADLSLFYNPIDSFESFEIHSGNNELAIQRVLSPWEESTITWGNQPPVTTDQEVILPRSVTGLEDYLDIDVSSLVADMKDSSLEGSHGFMFRLTDEVDYYRSVLFASSEHPDSSLHPELKVCWLEQDPILSVAPKLEKADWRFELFPNPSKGVFQLNVTGIEQTALIIDVYNTIGQHQGRYTNYDGSSLELNSKGIYFVIATDRKGRRMVQKLWVQ
ncbi:MAG: DNRLRE domain-containing protein [Bacteroidota bacterium]